MNQMGHGLPNLLGIDPSSPQERINAIVPGTMVMGTNGMGDMSEHLGMMATPRNSIAMLGGQGPYGPIDMGGMFTLVKVRDDIDYNRDPGWYKQPRGTSAWRVDSMSETAMKVESPHAGDDK